MKRYAKPDLKQLGQRKPKPAMEWQTGDFEKHAELKFIIPDEVLVLCKLTGITPKQLLEDFMSNLCRAGGPCSRSEDSGSCLMEYFLQNEYGSEAFFPFEIRHLLNELGNITSLWPKGADMEFLEAHAAWKAKYLEYLYAKWEQKERRPSF